MKKLKNKNQEILYKVIEKDIKHSYLKPENGYLLITKSKKMSLKFIIGKIKENFDYYHLKTMKTKEDLLYLWNKPYKLIITKANNFSYLILKDKIVVKSLKNDYLKVKEKILKEELNNFLLTVETEVKKTLKKENYYQVPIKLKLLKSKYGSYNLNKNSEYIVLNTFLATLEKEFTLYVLYHEYAHQKIKNHQKEFYQALDKLFDNHQKYQKLIKQKKLII